MHLNLALFIPLCILLAFAYQWVKRWQQAQPSLPASSVEALKGIKPGKIVLHKLSQTLKWATLFFLIVAISNPTKQGEEKKGEVQLAKSELPREGIAIYFLLDESGSMAEKVPSLLASGRSEMVRKIDLAKRAILGFINGSKGLDLPGRRSDLVGLIAFARVPEILCPLTLNRSEFSSRLNAIQPIGQEELNGTAIGYAIFKAVNIIVATKHFANRVQEAHLKSYAIDNQAIIIITDGLQSPHPDDKENPFRFMPPEEAINYAKQNGIKVFFVGVDPIFSKREFQDDVSKLKAAIQTSGGEFFLLGNGFPLEDIFCEIDKLEKSELPREKVIVGGIEKKRQVPMWDLFVVLALCSLALSALLETTVARSCP